jgi:monovalent cation/hydrogen antiporter
VALGIALARAYLALIARVEDVAPSVVLQFLGTFGVWLLADALRLSAVLMMVAYAVTLARTAPSRMGARKRRSSYAVWDVAVFVLNVLAFILVGLQLRGILGRVDGRAGRYAFFAAAVLAAVILVRIAWVMSYYVVARWKDRRFGSRPRRPLLPRTVQAGVVISWCGMRGIVTLAAALALPAAFPGRDLILFASFCVVLGTLVLQGLTLRPLLSRLTLPPDESVDQEVALGGRASCARRPSGRWAPRRRGQAAIPGAAAGLREARPDRPGYAAAPRLGSRARPPGCAAPGGADRGRCVPPS